MRSVPVASVQSNEVKYVKDLYDGVGNVQYDYHDYQLVFVVEQRGHIVIYKTYDSAIKFVQQLKGLGTDAHITTHKLNP